MATRRSNYRVEVPITSVSSSTVSTDPNLRTNDRKTMAQLDAPPPYSSAWLPTLTEALFFAIYPGTLLVGSLFSTLTIDHEETPYVGWMQSYDPTNAPSYFAKKSNLFNVYFVKIGWAWATFAVSLFILGSRALGPLSYITAPQQTVTRRRLQAFTRWAVLTAVWYAFTQNFFGAPLIDRGFRFTGGKCDIALSEDVESMALKEHMSKAEAAATHAACRLIGGRWKGGHDISGHVFLLVMGSAMLWLEVLPVVLGWPGLTRARKLNSKDTTTETKAVGRQVEDHGLIFGVALAVAALSLWMLLMTAAYFHTWFEKFTGLVVALLAIYLTYFVPRAIPAVRRVLGVPGI